MSDALRMRLWDVPTMVDPTTGPGDIAPFPDAIGQGGLPFVRHVADPPHQQQPRHHQSADVMHVYTDGELHIEGQGVYRVGDLRWTRAGHPYGPETTGPQGGAWWMITQCNPPPVNHEDEQSADIPPQGPPPAAVEGSPRFQAPSDLPRIASVVRDHGVAILEGCVEPALLGRVASKIDRHLRGQPGSGAPMSGSAGFDTFLGHRALRLHGLVAKAPSSQDLIADERLLQISRDILGCRAIALSCCARWVRSVEKSLLKISTEVPRGLSRVMKALLGFTSHEATARFRGMQGIYKNGDPQCAQEN